MRRFELSWTSFSHNVMKELEIGKNAETITFDKRVMPPQESSCFCGPISTTKAIKFDMEVSYWLEWSSSSMNIWVLRFLNRSCGNLMIIPPGESQDILYFYYHWKVLQFYVKCMQDDSVIYCTLFFVRKDIYLIKHSFNSSYS